MSLYLKALLLLEVVVVFCAVGVAANEGKGGGLMNYARETARGFLNGLKEMKSDSDRCNEIRSKQKLYKSQLKERLLAEGMDNKEAMRQVKNAKGGIDFHEFMLLRKGERDRSKLLQLALYTVVFPKALPYIIMFNSNSVLPDQLNTRKKATDADHKNAIIQSLSRRQTALSMIMEVEKNAKVQPTALVPFIGKEKRKRKMMSNQDILNSSVDFLTSKDQSPENLFKIVDHEVFQSGRLKPASKFLTRLPNFVTKSLVNSIERSNGGPLGGLKPNFLARGALLSHLKKVAESDEFLVNQKVDLEQIHLSDLKEVCEERLIGTIGRTENDMRNDLSDWLRYTAILPARRVRATNEHYYADMARSVMMCYFTLEDLCTNPTESPSLPRLAFQSSGATSKPVIVPEVEPVGKSWLNRK